MKHCFVLALLLLVFSNVHAQWVEIAPYPGTAAIAPVSFVIDDKAYVGGGIGSSEFWEYTPATDSWLQIADIPGGPRGYAFGLTIDGIGYVGTGDPDGDTSNAKFDVYAYDPSSNNWTRVADYTYLPRAGTFSFVHNGKAYVGGGFNNLGLYGDMYSFTPESNAWIGEPDIPEYQWMSTSAFYTLNDRLYVGTGSEDIETSGWGRWKRKKSIQTDEFFVFDPQTNKWTKLPSFPGGIREGCVGFTAGGKGYIGGGVTGPFSTATPKTDIWCHDPATNTWTALPAADSLPTTYSMWANAFTINNVVYMGLGVKLPQKSPSKKMWKYDFGSMLTSSLLQNQLKVHSTPHGGSKDTVFTLINGGSSSLSISSISVSNDASGTFTVQNAALPIELSAGQTTEVTVTAAPAALGNFTADLVVTSNAASGPTFSIPMSVTGREPAPVIRVEPDVIAFGNIDAGTDLTKSFSISNDGETVLNITSLLVENDFNHVFTMPGVSTPLQIPVGATETIDVKYAPANGGTFSGEVRIVSDAANGSPMVVNLSGSAGSVERTIEYITTSVSIQSVEIGSYAEETVTVKNPGANALTITTLAIENDPDGYYTIESAPAPFVLNSNETTDIVIRFTPAEEGTFTADLRIKSNADNSSSKQIPITGYAYTPTAPAILVEPEGLDFGDVYLTQSQEQQFTINSVGTLKLRVEDVQIQGNQASSFSLKNYSPPTTLLPGGSKKITVVFAPQDILDHEAELVITSDAVGAESVSIFLYGYTPDPTGVNDPLPLPEAANIGIYPNPVVTGGTFYYNYEGTAPEPAALAVYNTLGQVVYQQPTFEIQPGTHALHFDAVLKSGIYLLTFQMEARPVTVPLVIVER